MPKFPLPIKSTYVPNWTAWECIREFIQNAKDEEDDKGNDMRVSYSRGVLTIVNHGARLDRSALLVGHTSKAHREDLRGQFGEGLNLALLAGVRAGLDIAIDTHDERWRATLEPVAEFGDETCLVLHTRKLKKQRGSVVVTVSGLNAREWQDIRDRFVFLSQFTDDNIVRTANGNVMLDPERRGKIYSKGVYVTTLEKFGYGYDLPNLEVDRDRNMLNVWDVQYAIGYLFNSAVAARPDLLAPQVYRMLRDDAEDTKHIHYNANADVREAIKNHFLEEMGENAVAVASIEESERVHGAGMRGVVANEPLRKILHSTMGSVSEIVNDAMRKVTAHYAWSDLDEAERANLKTAATAINEVVEGKSVLSHVDVVDFADPAFQGMCEMASGRIQVARKSLESVIVALQVLVHELAHQRTNAGDGHRAHVDEIERIWSLLWAARGAN